jgi:hypothetical protein
VNASANTVPAEAWAVVGDRGWRLADHEVVGVDDIHHPAVGAEVVDVQDAFGLGDSAT